MADFLDGRLLMPIPLSKAGEVFFAMSLSNLLDRMAIPYRIQVVDLQPSKSRMFIPGWEAEMYKPSRLYLIEVDGAVYYSRGNFINEENAMRITDMLEISKKDLAQAAGHAAADHDTRIQIVSYMSSLSSAYYNWKAFLTPVKLEEALPL